MIDARTYHAPAKAPGLVVAATKAAGTQRELARRLGVTPRYLQMLAKGEGEMSYALQVCLERIIELDKLGTPAQTKG